MSKVYDAFYAIYDLQYICQMTDRSGRNFAWILNICEGDTQQMNKCLIYVRENTFSYVYVTLWYEEVRYKDVRIQSDKFQYMSVMVTAHITT